VFLIFYRLSLIQFNNQIISYFKWPRFWSILSMEATILQMTSSKTIKSKCIN